MPIEEVDPKKMFKAWVYDGKLKEKEKSKRFRHLTEHNIYGSAQLTPAKFKEFLTEIALGRPVVVFDLRQESHLVLNGDIPISLWRYKNNVNKGMSHSEVEKLDRSLVDFFREQRTLQVHDIIPYKTDKIPSTNSDDIQIHSIETWEDYVSNLGVEYKRMSITDHHRPTDDVVDLIVENIRHLEAKRKLEPDTALLVYCRGGRGRTTTIMSMCSMLLDTNDLSLDQIVQEQQSIGGVSIKKNKNKDVRPEGDSEYLLDKESKNKASISRSKFIENFFSYAKDSVGGYKAGISWTQWLTKQDLKAHKLITGNLFAELEIKHAAKQISTELSMIVEQSIITADTAIAKTKVLQKELSHKKNESKLSALRQEVEIEAKNAEKLSNKLADFLEFLNKTDHNSNKILEFGINVGQEICEITRKASEAAHAMEEAATARLRVIQAKEHALVTRRIIKDPDNNKFKEIESQAKLAENYAHLKLIEVESAIKKSRRM